METQQLKKFAERVRALLENASITITYSQALDLSASIVGLRNWPEVCAFPQRVSSQELDLSATRRLAYRLARKHGHQIGSTELLQLLAPSAEVAGGIAPVVWPAGPRSGVYLATSQTSIDALVTEYQDATDGAVFFAERAGSQHKAAIDLGDYGLWSSGLDRVPSGTLLVLGPVELDQQSWVEASERIEMACLHAANAGHRVAILFDSPVPEQLGADVRLMVSARNRDDLNDQIVGRLRDDGKLIEGVSKGYCAPARKPLIATASSLPDAVNQQLRTAVNRRPTGILAMGSIADTENPGADIAEAGLALSDHLGPAARIMPRHRSTMSKFDDVPAAIQQLPFLPSVESAYAQGYRRFVIDPRYTKPESYTRFLSDSLFIAFTYASTVEELAGYTAVNRGRDASLLPWLVAAVTVTSVQTTVQLEKLTDLYIGNPDAHVDDSEKVYDYVVRQRELRIEEQFEQLVNSGAIDIEGIRQAGAGNRTLKRLMRLLDKVES